MKNIKPISIAIATLALTGCAATQKANERIETDTRASEVKYEGSSVKSSAAAMAKDDSNKNLNFVKSTRNWVNPIPLSRHEDEKTNLPDIFVKKVAMTMPGTVNVVEVLTELQRASGIRFALAQDVYSLNVGQAKVISAQGGSTAAGSAASPLLISDFVFNGSMKDALDLLSSKANLSWKWNGTNIEIFRYETKTYNISALAGATSVNSNVELSGATDGSASSGGGGGGQGANAGKAKSSVARQATLTTWDEVRSFLVAQMSGNGSLAVLESTGAVTITDIPVVHKKLQKTIDDLNALLTKQVFMNVDIYAVSDAAGDNAGIDWNLMWTKGKYSSGYTSDMGAQSSAQNQFSVGVLSGKFAGTNVMLNALSTVGKTSLLNQFSVTTLNGQPAPIASNKRIGYLASVKVTPATSSTSQPQVELVAGEILAGINLSVIPKVEPNGQIILEYVMNLSDVTNIRSYQVGQSSIELPTSELKTVSNRALLRSGETLVLSGFKQQKAKNDQSGVGHPSNMLLGGKVAASVEDQYLVVTVTPYVAQNNARK